MFAAFARYRLVELLLMKKFALIALFITGFLAAHAQLEPSKEDIAKYGHLMDYIDSKRPLNEAFIRKADSLYRLDSNSLALKGILGELNFKLIYDSLRTDRVSQTIGLINNFLTLDTSASYKIDAYFSLASLYRYGGDFKTSIQYYEKLKLMSPDDNMLKGILNNLASTYNYSGQNQKALQTLRQLPDVYQSGGKGSLAADIYLKNGLKDSALLFANYAIEQDTSNIRAYTTKAKVLLTKHDKYNACVCLNKATQLIAAKKTEALLNTRDKKNAFVAALYKEITDVQTLVKQNCTN